MDCTFTGRTLILSKATKPRRADSAQLREVMKISGHIELEAFAGEQPDAIAAGTAERGHEARH